MQPGCLCETWGDAPEPIPGWHVFSQSRDRRQGGGVALLVRDDAPARRLKIWLCIAARSPTGALWIG